MSIDLERVRSDTPGCANVAYLNNAGSALPPDHVVDRTTNQAMLITAVEDFGKNSPA